MINTYNLFSVQVVHGKLPIQIDLFKKIKKYVDENYSIKEKYSCREGFQYHEDFEGKKELDLLLNNYFGNTYGLQIASGWINVLGNNSYNHPHHHAGSGNINAAVIYFSNENNNIVFLKENETFEIKPKLFDYLMFPHSLVHYVLPEQRQEKRISYAFNLRSV